MDPVQEETPKVPKFNQEQQKQVDLEKKAMLEKRSISKVCHSKKEFYSSLFLISKKDGGSHAVINLKDLNQFIPYKHFKMEGLQKYVLQKMDYMCKIDLKDAYFSVALHKDLRNLARFLWAGNLYGFLSLCFGLAPAPAIFTKLLKVPISALRRLMITVIIYLDDLLILGNSMSEIVTVRGSVIFLLQDLGFVISLKKCVLYPVQEIELLGLILNYHTMTLSLPNKKIVKIKDHCLSFYKASGFDKTNSHTFFNHSSSAPSPSTISLLTATVNFISKTNTVLPHFGKTDSRGKKRIVMVGQQSRTLQ